MPSFSEIIGVIVTSIVLSVASGHGDWVWKGIASVHHDATLNAKKSWGNPSIFTKGVN